MRTTVTTTVRLALAGAFALGMVAGSAPPATASPAGDTIYGGCSFDTEEQAIVTGGQNVGVIADTSVTTDAANRPIGATVECYIEVNGIKQPSTDLLASGNGVQANAKQISFPAYDYDTIWVVQCVTYADGSTDPCMGPCACEVQIPPQQVIDLLNKVTGPVNAAWIQYVDPVVCPQLVKLAGNYGPVTIAADGDVSVNDPLGMLGMLYDCPPYDPA